MLPTSRGADGARTLRRLNVPRSLQVRADASGAPSAVLRSGLWRAVAGVQDRYRTDDRWWTERPVSRAYYELLLEDSRTAAVFRDEIAGEWWEQRHG